jgi:S1-C subfamily serine protease
LPSVVSINAEVTTTDIFGNPTTQQGAGSGWVIDANGLIVTNNHVVQGAQNVTISTPDGRNFPAQRILTDPLTDLAVIKINASGLPAVKLGDSNKLKQGMMVTAIGNSLGQGIRVTAGWVSRLGVSLTLPPTSNEPGGTLFDLIEVTAPINPGNSGGPLVDMLGEVVGITNAKLVATGVEAVGYAISTQTALPILQQLVQTGQVIRPYLGASFLDVTPMLASVYGFPVNRGAIIAQLDRTSPADLAGLRLGDIIVEMNNTTISSSADALRVILTSQIGQRLSINFYRGNNRSTVQVILVQNPGP